MKVTVDTNFLISATQWDYSVVHKLLKKFILLDAKIFTTQDILDETTKVLGRDFKYSKDEAKNIIEKILLFAKLIESKQRIDIIKDDPDDNKVIECAIESSSDYIITYDKHLLKIREYKHIKILKPETVINFAETQFLISLHLHKYFVTLSPKYTPSWFTICPQSLTNWRLFIESITTR